jgi:molybdopterin-guanine dinucleotide biosynthesis adapter protein
MSREFVEQPLVVAIVGRSGAGKTTLLESLIPMLEERGLRVAAVKHASHGFLADRPGKDSHRLYEAGACSVALVSREQVATFSRSRTLGGEHGRPPRLADVVAELPGRPDIVLAEGFSWEPVARVVVVPDGEMPLGEHLRGGPILERIVAPATPSGVRPVFSRVRLLMLAVRLARLVRFQPGARPRLRAIALA